MDQWAARPPPTFGFRVITRNIPKPSLDTVDQLLGAAAWALRRLRLCLLVRWLRQWQVLAREVRRETIWARPNSNSCLMSRPSWISPPTIPPPMTPPPQPLPAASRGCASSAAAAAATVLSSRMWPSIWVENWYNIALPLQNIHTIASTELMVSHCNKVEDQHPWESNPLTPSVSCLRKRFTLSTVDGFWLLLEQLWNRAS